MLSISLLLKRYLYKKTKVAAQKAYIQNPLVFVNMNENMFSLVGQKKAKVLVSLWCIQENMYVYIHREYWLSEKLLCY